MGIGVFSFVAGSPGIPIHVVSPLGLSAVARCRRRVVAVESFHPGRGQAAKFIVTGPRWVARRFGLLCIIESTRTLAIRHFSWLFGAVVLGRRFLAAVGVFPLAGAGVARHFYCKSLPVGHERIEPGDSEFSVSSAWVLFCSG